MAGPKSFLRLVGGRVTNIVATVVSAGPANAGDLPALNDLGVFDFSLFPAGIGPDLTDGNASGAVPVRGLGWVRPDGTLALASATAGSAHVAEGVFVAAAGDGQPARLIHNPQKIAGFTGLTPDAPVFLSETAGAYTQTPVTGTGGKLHQYIGWAISASTILYQPQPDAILLP